MKTSKYNLAAAVALTLALFVTGTASSVQAIDLIGGTNPALNNGNYSLPSNFGSVGGGGILAADVTAPIGQGPWNGRARGILGILAQPSISINGAPNPPNGLNATISGLATVSVGGLLLGNGGSVFETVPGNPGGVLPSGPTQYTLTGDFSSTNPLTLALLANSGFGFAITTGGTQGATPTPGTDVANSFTGMGSPLITLNLLTANTGNFSLVYTSPTLLSTAGVRLFTGENPVVLNATVLTDVTFDNTVLTAIAVPEPSTWALALAGAGVLLMLARRKRGAAVS